MLPFHKGDRIATTAGGERSASRPQSKALWELSPLTRGTAKSGSSSKLTAGIIPADAGNGERVVVADGMVVFHYTNKAGERVKTSQPGLA